MNTDIIEVKPSHQRPQWVKFFSNRFQQVAHYLNGN